ARREKPTLAAGPTRKSRHAPRAENWCRLAGPARRIAHSGFLARRHDDIHPAWSRAYESWSVREWHLQPAMSAPAETIPPPRRARTGFRQELRRTPEILGSRGRRRPPHRGSEPAVTVRHECSDGPTRRRR